MLIIFDCDGVLVDSEHLAAKIFSDTLLRIGIDIDPEQCYLQFHGKTLSNCYEWVEKHKNVILPKSFHAELSFETEKKFSAHLKPIAGVDKIVHYLVSKNIKYCVASNGGHKKIKNSLQATGLIDYFPHRYSAEDVSSGKPNPELFLYAASQMAVSPKNTIVIEDSDAGKRAALSANMGLIMFQQIMVAGAVCNTTCASMEDVLAHLKAIVEN